MMLMVLGCNISRVGEVVVGWEVLLGVDLAGAASVFWKKVARAEFRMDLKEVLGAEMEGAQIVSVTNIFERAIAEEA